MEDTTEAVFALLWTERTTLMYIKEEEEEEDLCANWRMFCNKVEINYDENLRSTLKL